ncbi:unnamed protein product [Amoebophrya sp. A25]|nr:unnamed protein product [Amoebophrya sp. A25]|eukprot:GSA25T00004311001.1
MTTTIQGFDDGFCVSSSSTSAFGRTDTNGTHPRQRGRNMMLADTSAAGGARNSPRRSHMKQDSLCQRTTGTAVQTEEVSTSRTSADTTPKTSFSRAFWSLCSSSKTMSNISVGVRDKNRKTTTTTRRTSTRKGSSSKLNKRKMSAAGYFGSIGTGARKAMRLFVALGGAKQVVAQFSAAFQGVILEDLDCPCQDKDQVCFIPVCPKGMYQCCFDCTISTCDRDALGFFPHGDLYLSERGVLECLQCKSGDFCSGCDSYQECPAFPTKNAAGAGTYEAPRVSLPGSILDRECQRCPDGFEADFSRDRCVPPFRNDCDMVLLEICLAGCKDNPTNDECQRMECRIFCANDQRDSNPNCLEAHKEMCQEFNLPIYDPAASALPGLATTTEAPTILLTDDSGIATVAPFRQEVPCSINCNHAATRGVAISMMLLPICLFWFNLL